MVTYDVSLLYMEQLLSMSLASTMEGTDYSSETPSQEVCMFILNMDFN